VTRVPPEVVPDPDPQLMTEVGQAVKVLDRNRLVMKKTTGWLIAALVVSVLAVTAFIGSTIFTREHQFEHLQEQVRELNAKLDLVRDRNQAFERRLVELETRLENLEGKR
jgi:septal ring factor EnvC (AmiA/AmiB activator)